MNYNHIKDPENIVANWINNGKKDTGQELTVVATVGQDHRVLFVQRPRGKRGCKNQ